MRRGLVLLALLIASLAARQQKAPALADVLKAAADYLVSYSETLGVVTAEEEFTQHDLSIGQGTLAPPARRLSSDFVFVGLDRGFVATYRDVYVMDGQPMRDRRNRLLETFQTSAVMQAMQEGRRLSAASAHEYISPNMQLFDDPLLALQFIRRDNQNHSTFKLDGVKTIGGVVVATLKYNETAMPRLIGAPGDPPGTGRFSIDAATGAIRQMDLSMSTRTYLLHVSVTFSEDPTLKRWLPTESYQQLEISEGVVANNNSPGNFAVHQSLEGRARYSKFQQGKLGG